MTREGAQLLVLGMFSLIALLLVGALIELAAGKLRARRVRLDQEFLARIENDEEFWQRGIRLLPSERMRYERLTGRKLELVSFDEVETEDER